MTSDLLTQIAATLAAARSALADGEHGASVMYCAAARGALASADEQIRRLRLSLVAVEHELVRIGALSRLPDEPAATPAPKTEKRAGGPVSSPREGGTR